MIQPMKVRKRTERRSRKEGLEQQPFAGAGPSDQPCGVANAPLTETRYSSNNAGRRRWTRSAWY